MREKGKKQQKKERIKASIRKLHLLESLTRASGLLLPNNCTPAKQSQTAVRAPHRSLYHHTLKMAPTGHLPYGAHCLFPREKKETSLSQHRRAKRPLRTQSAAGYLRTGAGTALCLAWGRGPRETRTTGCGRPGASRTHRPGSGFSRGLRPDHGPTPRSPVKEHRPEGETAGRGGR